MQLRLASRRRRLLPRSGRGISACGNCPSSANKILGELNSGVDIADLTWHFLASHVSASTCAWDRNLFTKDHFRMLVVTAATLHPRICSGCLTRFPSFHATSVVVVLSFKMHSCLSEDCIGWLPVGNGNIITSNIFFLDCQPTRVRNEIHSCLDAECPCCWKPSEPPVGLNRLFFS